MINKFNPFANFYSSSLIRSIIEPITIKQDFFNPEEIVNRLISLKIKKVTILSPFDLSDLNSKLEKIGIKYTIINSSIFDRNKLDIQNWSVLNGFQEKHDKSSHLLLIGALESVWDIRPVLATIRNMLMDNKINGCSVSFINQKSFNKTFYRYWEENEAKTMLKKAGFLLKTEKSVNSLENNFFVSLDCSFEQYQRFLATNNLTSNGFKHLMVTTEHPDYRITGGLGSYIKECSRFYNNDSAVMIIDNNRDIDYKALELNKWLSVQTFVEESKIDHLISLDHNHLSGVIFESLLSVIFYYPNIKSIEFQEGAAFRVIQAKKSQIFPKNIKIITSCHGSSFFLAQARKSFLEPELIQNSYREKFCVEESDLTIFPTKYLQDSYATLGIYPKNSLIRRLPFDVDVIPEGKSLKEYKRIIYVGKTNKTKGFDIFLRVLKELHEKHPKTSEKIEEVIAIVTYLEINEKEVAMLFEELSQYFNIKLISLNRSDLMDKLSEYSKDSLALITYPGDNHPTVILELMAIGHDFVTTLAGGIPELIDDKFKPNYLVPIEEHNFAKFVSRVIERSSQRERLIKELRLWYINNQNQINKLYEINELAKHFEADKIVKEKQDLKYSVVVPIFNTPLSQVVDLCKAINWQSIAPFEVIFINDGSTTKNYLELLSKTVKKTILVKFRIINQKNKGLAGARNTGLFESKTNYVAFIDSDDIPNNRCFEQMSSYIENNPENDIVTGYCKYFYDGKETGYLYKFTNGEHQPIIQQLGTAFYPQNNYATATVFVKKDKIVELGGWDESDKSMWEDWAFNIKATAHGIKLGVIPSIVYQYRVRENSMLRSYPKYPAEMRLIRNYDVLSRFDSYILFSQLKIFNEMYFEGKLPPHLSVHDKSLELGGAEKLIIIYRNKTPKILRKVIYLTSRTTYRSAKKVYRFLKIR